MSTVPGMAISFFALFQFPGDPVFVPFVLIWLMLFLALAMIKTHRRKLYGHPGPCF